MKISTLTLLSNLIIDFKKSVESLKRTGNDKQPTKEIKAIIEKHSIYWFEDLEHPLIHYFKFDKSYIDQKHAIFDNLLRIIPTQAKSKTYLNLLNQLLPELNSIVIEVKKHADNPTSISRLINYLNRFDESIEKEYIKEAIRCAEHNLFKASIVLGWCSVISKMHSFIQNRGFSEFNQICDQIYNIQSGRYKRFSAKISVTSIAELQTIFDSHLLWIFEFWNIIDSNEHERLSLCFTMRNNCAHPGNAPITEDNLISFYSDICEIVHFNNKFS